MGVKENSRAPREVIGAADKTTRGSSKYLAVPPGDLGAGEAVLVVSL